VLHYPKGVVVLHQDGSELHGGEGPSHVQLDRAAVQAAEDTRTEAEDELCTLSTLVFFGISFNFIAKKVREGLY